MQLDPVLTEIVLNAKTAAAALTELVAVKRTRLRSFSLAAMGKRTGLSKSYLSEVISGKKQVPHKSIGEVGKYLGLGYLEIACLEALLLLEKSKIPEERLANLQQLEKTKRVLRLVSFDETPKANIDLLEFDLYAAFGLFKANPTSDELCKLFSTLPKLTVENAINCLVSRKAIEKTEDSSYKYSSKGLVFNASEDPNWFIDIWKQSINDALANLPKWASNRNESCFASYVVSVQKDQYVKSLEVFKNQLLQFASASDSTDANELVRINVQVYPLSIH